MCIGLAVHLASDVRMAPLGNTVTHIVGCGSEEQMVGTDTLRIVALVADQKIVGYFPVSEGVGNAVSHK